MYTNIMILRSGLPIIRSPKHGQAPFKPHVVTHLKLAHIEEHVAVRGAHQFELVDVPEVV